jgi:hypothetical protein
VVRRIIGAARDGCGEGEMRKLVVSIFFIAAFSVASVAIAAPPIKATIGPFEVVGQFVADCGDFQVLNDYRFEATIHDYFDKSGVNYKSLIKQWYSPSIYYNSTEPSFWVAGNPAEHEQIWLNFEKGFLAASGPAVKVVLPGGGVVFHSAGRVVFDFALGEFVFIAGPHDPIYGNVGALCAALRP